MQNENCVDTKKICDICLKSTQSEIFFNCSQCGRKAHQMCIESVKAYSPQEKALYKMKCESCSSKVPEKECDLCKKSRGGLMYQVKEAEKNCWVSKFNKKMLKTKEFFTH